MDKKQFIPIYEKDDGKGSFVWFTSKLLDETYNLDLLSIIKNSPYYGKEPGYEPNYTKTLRKQVPDNLCLYPFTHFQLDPDGRARPCCKYKVGDATWHGDVPKLPDVNIQELWEQQEFQDLRDQFLRNERPSGCKACWDEEAAGITSMRLTREQGGKEHPYATFYHHIPRQYPKTLDLKLSNLCNLKCRICTPYLSSQWIKEIKDLEVRDMGDPNSFTRNSREKFLEDPTNAEILKQWAPGIDYMEFYGGEPLMQQEHDRILKIMFEHGKPEVTGLYYNTNSTIFKEHLFTLWKPFREVVINFSIDDIKDRFEYQRHNAKWTETLANIKKYKAYSKAFKVNMDLRVYATVGILNVFYLKEFFDELRELDVKVTLNMVHYPHHYSIVNLPTAIKDIIKEKLVSIDTDLIHHQSLNIENIVNFMYGNECNTSLLNLFFVKTHQHDNYRKESFENTFPELYELLKEYDT
jgi:MoaA/NifB/PqqE/SkfB family radical SAM enzyme